MNSKIVKYMNRGAPMFEQKLNKYWKQIKWSNINFKRVHKTW
jgi:hypothetical protein